MAPADLPMSYYFAVAVDQDDELDGGESVEPDTVAYMHTGLSLADTVDVPITARYATQTLKVYVHHERDQVEGYTGGVRGADQRMSGMLDIEVRYVSANGRTTSFTNDVWNAAMNTTDTLGVLTFTGVPADMNVVATARAAEDTNIILIGDEQLAAYEDFDDNGVTGSAFGDLGGFHHTVELCPLLATAPAGQGHNECASFAYISAFTVDGQAWKGVVRKEADDDGFRTTSSGRVSVSKVGVAGTVVTLDPVEGKNLAGDSESFDAGATGTKTFDFGEKADGVYEIGIPAGWVATAGAGGDKLPKEFLLADHLTSDEDDDGEDDHVNIDVTPTTGYLYGIVTDDTGLPAEGVTVDVNGGADVDGGASGETDEYGRYIIEGFSGRRPPRAEIVVTAYGPGYGSKTDSTGSAIRTFKPNTPVSYKISLTGSGDVAVFAGTVTKAGGGSVSGVTITVEGSTLLNPNATSPGVTENDIYKTGPDGTYRVEVRAAVSVTLTASMKGLSFSPEAGHTVSAVAQNNPVSGLDFTAFEHGTIAGRVIRNDPGGSKHGHPVQHVKITATPVSDDDEDEVVSATTNSAGSFALSVRYGAYEIEATSEGYDYKYPNTITTVNVAPGQTLEYGDIEATLTGDGRPPRFTKTEFKYAKGSTNADGSVKSLIGKVTAADDDEPSSCGPGMGNHILRLE